MFHNSIYAAKVKKAGKSWRSSLTNVSPLAAFNPNSSDIIMKVIDYRLWL
jgi:hypothetical protein